MSTEFDRSYGIQPEVHENTRKILIDNLHKPFKSEQLIVAFENLAVKIVNDLEGYDTIVGDDISGRLPTMVISSLATRKRFQLNLGKPRILYYDAGSNLYNHSEICKSNPKVIEEISKDIEKHKSKINKALIVTENIYSGKSMNRLIEIFQEHKIKPDVCTITMCLRDITFPNKLFFGDMYSASGSIFYMNPFLSGVKSVPDSAFSVPDDKIDHQKLHRVAMQNMKLLTNYLWRIIE